LNLVARAAARRTSPCAERLPQGIRSAASARRLKFKFNAMEMPFFRRARRIGAMGLFSFVVSSYAVAGTESYSYDALGRLSTVTYPDNSEVVYKYDAAGNRSSVAGGTPPAVSAVTFSAATVSTGDTVTLSATVSHATNYTVSCTGSTSYSTSGSAFVSGGVPQPTALTVPLTPSGTGATTCTVTGTNAIGSAASASGSFQVVAAPTVNSVTFASGYVTTGAANSVSWSTSNATSVGVSCSGTASYSYSGTTVNYSGAVVGTSGTGTGTCSVTAHNAAGKAAVRSNTFQVVAAPSVSAVTFSAATATTGGTDTMYATVSNATNYAVSCTGSTSYSTSGSAFMSGGVPQPTALMVPLTPSGTGTTTCTVTGTNAASSSAAANGSFQVVAAPVVNSVSFASGYVTTGTANSVSWTTTNATSVGVSCSGTASYSYSGATVNYSGAVVGTSGMGTGTCSVTAYNAAGASAVGSNTFQVVAAPSVSSASFSPTSVAAGTASTFSWATSNATSATVSCSGAGSTAAGVGTSNSMSVGTSSQGTATCTVTASNAAGTTATGGGSLTVTAPIPVPFNSSGYYTFINPNAFPVTPTAVGAVGTGTTFSASNSTCKTTSAVAAGGSCTVAFSVVKPSCGGNSGNAYVTDAGGSTSGATLYAASGKMCP